MSISLSSQFAEKGRRQILKMKKLPTTGGMKEDKRIHDQNSENL